MLEIFMVMNDDDNIIIYKQLLFRTTWNISMCSPLQALKSYCTFCLVTDDLPEAENR